MNPSRRRKREREKAYLATNTGEQPWKKNDDDEIEETESGI